MHNFVLVVLVAYIVGMISIGVYFRNKTKNNEDYYLAGKKLPGWAIAISERATTSSSWVMLGATGAVYTMGYSGIWLFFGLYTSLIVYWLWFAKAFKRENDKDPAITLTSFLAKRWGRHERTIRLLCILIISFFYLIYASSQFVGATKTINTLFDVDAVTTMIVVALAVVIYSSLGGLSAIVWTDVVQAIIMCFSLVILPVIAYVKIYAMGLSVFDSIMAAGPDYASFIGGMSGGAVLLLIFNETSWIWGNFGMPAVTQKIMALDSDNDIRIGRNTGLIWGIIWYLGIFSIGITGIVLYGAGTLADPETLFPTMVSDLLPTWLAALALCGVIAAILSTTADQLLAITGAISVDLIQNYMGVKTTEEKSVLLSRLTLIGAGILAFFIAFKSRSLIMTMISFAWTGMGSSLGPAVILTLLYKKTSGIGIIATLISGVLLTFTWKYIPVLSAVHARAGTFFAALMIGIVVSVLVPNCEDKSESACVLSEG
ncbi:sodium/proline symporter [Synergistaceae bacterium OttesenSCG-928-I11]|nr:sodium/proline symporter [Synergistaceae bacterium OttesenSCG-928-I11]